MINFVSNRDALRSALLFVFLCSASAASAAPGVTETSRVDTYISYDMSGFYGGYDGVSGDIFAGAGNFGYDFVGNGANKAAMSFDVTTQLDSAGNFFFLHNASCVGSCYLSIETFVTFTLTNNSGAEAAVRFDSMITPGHLARQNFAGGAVEANFNFTLVDGAFTRPFAFQATGEAASNPGVYGTNVPAYLQTYGTPGFSLNGANAQTSGGAEVIDGGAAPNWSVLDWGATNIGVDLAPLYAGETRNFTYVLSTFLRMESNCTDFATCAGLQVSFGDPRNNGTVDGLAAMNYLGAEGASGLAQFANSSYSPVVGAQYDPFNIGYAFTPQSTPDTRVNPDVTPIRYDGIFVPNVGNVPEPSAWALLILGFGAVGRALRRRLRGVRIATA